MNPPLNPDPAPAGSDSGGLAAGQPVGNGRFKLVRLLGKGGMGIVWLAQDTRLGQQVALKFLPPEIRADADALDDMRRETVRSIKLSHPSIIRIHDLHEYADELFIAMEFVDGTTLSAVKCASPNRVMSWEEVKPMLRRLCDALDYAHGERVIHRDLKPANMMVDARGRVKLADFGIAAAVSDSMSRVSLKNTTSGTMAYMSPQQMNGQRPQPTDDIYALGATLYELLTSRPPFYSGNITHQVQDVAPLPMEERLAEFEIQNDIPADVCALVMACLAKEPGDRPQSAGAVAEWIDLELGTEKKSNSRLLPASAEEPVAEPVEEPQAAEQAEEEFAVETAPVTSAGSKLGLWTGVAVAPVALLVAGVWLMLANAAKKKSAAPSSTINGAGTVLRPNAAAASASLAAGWVALFDGKTLSGWTAPDPGDWQIESDGSVFSQGPRSLLFSPQTYTNLEFKAQIKLGPNANGGIYFRTRRSSGSPAGYHAQAANSDKNGLTGSLFQFKTVTKPLAKDNEWFTQHVVVAGNRIVIKINNQIPVDYTDLQNTHQSGFLALEHWSPNIAIRYRNVMVKPLPANPAAAWAEARKDLPELPAAFK